MKGVGNISASVRQRLLNRARRDRRPFNELLQYYAMERFLYRLSRSVHAGRFVLKGALLLRVWHSPELRPTMDIDLLGITSNEETHIAAQIRDILSMDLEVDGLNYDPGSIQAERITEDADYRGIRIRFLCTLGSARIHMQIDIGFGDAVYPEPEESEFPTMLGSPGPRLLCYSRESTIAEKLEAVVKLGMLNSRMKDSTISGCCPGNSISRDSIWSKPFAKPLNGGVQYCLRKLKLSRIRLSWPSKPNGRRFEQDLGKTTFPHRLRT